jgi:hypothetical protein
MNSERSQEASFRSSDLYMRSRELLFFTYMANSIRIADFLLHVNRTSEKNDREKK